MQTELISQMADSLRALRGLDLNDERACFKALSDVGFRSGDIVALGGKAAAEARHRGAKLAGVIGDAAAMIFAAGVWLAWYCVLCPVA